MPKRPIENRPQAASLPYKRLLTDVRSGVSHAHATLKT